jgi:hypothetical protein
VGVNLLWTSLRMKERKPLQCLPLEAGTHNGSRFPARPLAGLLVHGPETLHLTQVFNFHRDRQTVLNLEALHNSIFQATEL